MKSAIFLVLLCAFSYQSLSLEATGASVVRSAIVDKSGHVEVPAETEAPPADAPAADAPAADAPADAATNDLAEEDVSGKDSTGDDDDDDDEDGDDDEDDAELMQEDQPEEEGGDDDEDANGDEEEDEETDAADDEASLIQDPEGDDEDADAGEDDEEDADADGEESFLQARQQRMQHIRQWVQKQQAKCAGEAQSKVCSAACGEKFKTTDNQFCSALRTLAKSNVFNEKTKRWSMSQHRIKCSAYLSKQPECTSEAGLCQGRMTHFLRATFKRSKKVAGTDRNWERRSSDKAKTAAAAHLPGCAATWL